MRYPNSRSLLCVLALAVAGCGAPLPTPDVPAGAPPEFPAERYQQPSADAPVYSVDTARSLIRINAYRDGALKRMGHDHVVASRNLTGFIRQVPTDGGRYRFDSDLYLPLAAMTVDEPALRADAGFETEPSAEDRAGTRGNMLKSLDAATQPFVTASLSTASIDRSVWTSGQAVEVVATLNLTLHGVTQALSVPVTARLEAGTLIAEAEFAIQQTDFDVAPFSVLGGALSVLDTLDIQIELFADSFAATPNSSD